MTIVTNYTTTLSGQIINLGSLFVNGSGTIQTQYLQNGIDLGTLFEVNPIFFNTPPFITGYNCEINNIIYDFSQIFLLNDSIIITVISGSPPIVTNDDYTFSLLFDYTNGTPTVFTFNPNTYNPITGYIIGGGGAGGIGIKNYGGGSGGGGGGTSLINIIEYNNSTIFQVTIGKGGIFNESTAEQSNLLTTDQIYPSYSYTAYGGTNASSSNGGSGGGNSTGGSGGLGGVSSSSSPGQNGSLYGGGGGAGSTTTNSYGGGGGGVAYNFINKLVSDYGFGGSANNTSASYNGGNGAYSSRHGGYNGQYGGGGGGGGNSVGNGGNGCAILQFTFSS